MVFDQSASIALDILSRKFFRGDWKSWVPRVDRLTNLDIGDVVSNPSHPRLRTEFSANIKYYWVILGFWRLFFKETGGTKRALAISPITVA